MWELVIRVWDKAMHLTLTELLIVEFFLWTFIVLGFLKLRQMRYKPKYGSGKPAIVRRNNKAATDRPKDSRERGKHRG